MKDDPGIQVPHAAGLIPVHLDYTSLIIPVALLVARYAWKFLMWLLAPGISAAVEKGIRKALQPELDRINDRLTLLETQQHPKKQHQYGAGH